MRAQPEGVRDEGLARVAHLGAVALLGERVGPADHVAVDVRVVRGDLGDEVVELRDGRREAQIQVGEILRHM